MLWMWLGCAAWTGWTQSPVWFSQCWQSEVKKDVCCVKPSLCHSSSQRLFSMCLIFMTDICDRWCHRQGKNTVKLYLRLVSVYKVTSFLSFLFELPTLHSVVKRFPPRLSNTRNVWQLEETVPKCELSTFCTSHSLQVSPASDMQLGRLTRL